MSLDTIQHRIDEIERREKEIKGIKAILQMAHEVKDAYRISGEEIKADGEECTHRLDELHEEYKRRIDEIYIESKRWSDKRYIESRLFGI